MTDQEEPRADADDEAAPPPAGRPRRIRLTTVDDVRAETARLYREMRTGRIAVKDGYTMTMALAQLARMTEATSLEARIGELEERMKGGGR